MRNGDESNPRAEANTPNIVDCTTFRLFWIEWADNGLITVGQGALRMGKFLEYHDTAFHPIHAVSVDTKDVEGQWIFADNIGMYTYIADYNRA